MGGRGSARAGGPGKLEVHGIGLGVCRACGLGEAEADLPNGWQIRRPAATLPAGPGGMSQTLVSGLARPVVDSFAAALADQGPEDLGSLHHGVEVFGGSGFGAENM